MGITAEAPRVNSPWWGQPQRDAEAHAVLGKYKETWTKWGFGGRFTTC